MPRGALVPVVYWIFFFGLVLWALTDGLPQRAAPFLSKENKSEQQNQARQANRADNQTAPQLPPIWVIAKGEKSAEPNWEKPNCQNPQNHDEADLCEQRRMSDAAEKAVLLNIIQAGIGVFALLGLALTVYYAYIAAFAAVDAAKQGKAAADATVEATKAATNQLILAFPPRIRLGIHHIWIKGTCELIAPKEFFAGDHVEGRVYVVSNGRGDAIIEASHCALRWYTGNLPMRPYYNFPEYRKDWDEFFLPYPNNGRPRTHVRPGGSRERMLKATVPEDYSSRYNLYLIGTIRYGDSLGESGKHRELRFCRRYDLRAQRFVAVRDPAYEMED